MNTISETPPPIPQKKPVLVWVISIYYFISIAWTIPSFILIHSGAFPLTEAQKAYFDSQTTFDYALIFVLSSLTLAAVVLLFRLKKLSFYFFIAAFGAGLLATVYQILEKNWLDAIGVPGLIGAIIGWGISIALILYSKHLITRGILK